GGQLRGGAGQRRTAAVAPRRGGEVGQIAVAGADHRHDDGAAGGTDRQQLHRGGGAGRLEGQRNRDRFAGLDRCTDGRHRRGERRAGRGDRQHLLRRAAAVVQGEGGRLARGDQRVPEVHRGGGRAQRGAGRVDHLDPRVDRDVP